MNFRVGYGYDVHRLVKGEKFILGGIELAFKKGCLAHSDGDVLIHSICDALLGAADLRDIGYHFPDRDEKYKNIDSKILLRKVVSLIQDKGFAIGNIDATVCLQKPKISDAIPLMKTALSPIFKISKENISIKATTTEGLGFIGKGKGVSASAVALIYKKS